MSHSLRRPRRLRRSSALRGLVRETRLSSEQLVLPIFLIDGVNRREPVASMPGVDRLSVDQAVEVVRAAIDVGVVAFDVFPAVDAKHKTPDAAHALDGDNLNCRAVRAIKQALPSACVFTDIALDPYSSHGHDGLVRGGVVVNDESVEMLAKMAMLHADCGADVVSPSDMMDGRVRAMRLALDASGHQDVAVCSYTAKYASALYGPFRDALDSAPVDAAGVPKDKMTYQMDPANSREAMVELALDEAEGADMILIKPALPYLDVIYRLRQATHLPIAAYHVSGEYAMACAAGERGWLDRDRVIDECVLSIARAGADIIFTYAAVELARRLNA